MSNRELSKWDYRFMRIAHEVASWSKDPRRKVGAVITSLDRRQQAIGYNGFPSGIEDSEVRLSDPVIKNLLVVHAELNALLNAPFVVKGCPLYCTRFPCVECTKAIIASNIGAVIVPESAYDPASKWQPEMANELLLEAGITVILIPGE